MRQSRGAASPIVSIIFLILVAVASIIVVFAWVSGLVSENPTDKPALSQKLKIDGIHVYDDGTYYDITIYIMNAGNEPISIKAAYIIDPSNNTIIAVNTTSLTVNEGSMTAIVVQDAFPDNTVGNYIAKVVTHDGIEALQAFSLS